MTKSSLLLAMMSSELTLCAWICVHPAENSSLSEVRQSGMVGYADHA
jgi:hypothetical protein